jgi:succinate dehydrogenase / fumarate reductase, membrane anchor subunit
MLIDLLTKKYPGMRQWLSQRITAVYLAVYSVLFVLLLLIQKPENYEAWLAFFSPYWWRALSLLFFVSLTIHAWLGVSNVFKDYIFNPTLRSYMQLLAELMLIADLIWATLILWRI